MKVYCLAVAIVLVCLTDAGHGCQDWIPIFEVLADIEEDPAVLWKKYYDLVYQSFWSDVKKVKFSFGRWNEPEHFVIFDAIGTDSKNWFSKERVLESSYVDLTPEATYNYFSIAGSDKYFRRFHIHRNYGGCGVDVGWFSNSMGDYCDWDRDDAIYGDYMAIQVQFTTSVIQVQTV